MQYFLVMSVDIQNENGESVLSRQIANCTKTLIDRDKVKKFNYLKTLYTLDRFLVHFLTSSFEGLPKDLEPRILPPGVVQYNYPLDFSLNPPVCFHSHSSIEVDKNSENGKMLLIPQEPPLDEKF